MLQKAWNLPLELAIALGKEIVTAIDGCNTVLENTLPFVLDTLHLVVKAKDHVIVVAVSAAVCVHVVRIIEVASNLVVIADTFALLSSSSIILLHNHPSGDPTPSRPDIDMTRQIVEAGRALKISVHDHLVVGREGVASFKALGLM